MIYVLVYWVTDEMVIGGCYSSYDLANDYAQMIPCACYEVRKYEVDSILLK